MCVWKMIVSSKRERQSVTYKTSISDIRRELTKRTFLGVAPSADRWADEALEVFLP